MTTVGSGAFTYEVVEPWPAAMLKYWSFESVVGVAVNSLDEVHVLGLSKHPLTIWSADGLLVSSWGEGTFSANPHGIYIDRDDHVWTVDRDYHIVTEHSPGGDVLRTLGNRLLPSPTAIGEPFNMPSGVAMAPNGDIFVSDGYGGHRMHRFSAGRQPHAVVGRAGIGPLRVRPAAQYGGGQPWPRIRLRPDERPGPAIRCERGGFLEQWTGFAEPCEVYIRDDVVYVAEQGDGSAVSIWTLDHELLARWRGDEGPDRRHAHGGARHMRRFRGQHIRGPGARRAAGAEVPAHLTARHITARTALKLPARRRGVGHAVGQGDVVDGEDAAVG